MPNAIPSIALEHLSKGQPVMCTHVAPLPTKPKSNNNNNNKRLGKLGNCLQGALIINEVWHTIMHLTEGPPTCYH